MNKKDFRIMYDSMSVGWHLRKITEVTKPMDKEDWLKFVGWIERHNLKEIWKKP